MIDYRYVDEEDIKQDKSKFLFDCYTFVFRLDAVILLLKIELLFVGHFKK